MKKDGWMDEMMSEWTEGWLMNTWINHSQVMTLVRLELSSWECKGVEARK